MRLRSVGCMSSHFSHQAAAGSILSPPGSTLHNHDQTSVTNTQRQCMPLRHVLLETQGQCMTVMYALLAVCLVSHSSHQAAADPSLSLPASPGSTLQSSKQHLQVQGMTVMHHIGMCSDSCISSHFSHQAAAGPSLSQPASRLQSNEQHLQVQDMTAVHHISMCSDTCMSSF